jgi:hypothetical protein
VDGAWSSFSLGIGPAQWTAARNRPSRNNNTKRPAMILRTAFFAGSFGFVISGKTVSLPFECVVTGGIPGHLMALITFMLIIAISNTAVN